MALKTICHFSDHCMRDVRSFHKFSQSLLEVTGRYNKLFLCKYIFYKSYLTHPFQQSTNVMHCNVCMFEGDVSAKAYYVKYIELFHFILGIDVSSMFGKRRNYLSDIADIRGISKSSGCVYNYIHQVIDAICTTLLRIWTFPLLRNWRTSTKQLSDFTGI